MKKFARIALVTLLTLFVLFADLRIDEEFCIYTAASTLRIKVFGITLHTHHDDGYRSWLRDNIGVNLGGRMCLICRVIRFWLVGQRRRETG